MKKLLIALAAFIVVICAGVFCFTQLGQSSRPAAQPISAAPTVPTQPTAALLGRANSLTSHFEHQYEYRCETNRDHLRCLSPNGAIKLTVFGDPVTEVTISIPYSEADNKPARYIQAMVFQTGLDTAAWDWLTPKLKEKEASKEFGDKRLTTQMDDEGWLVTVEVAK